MVRLGTIRQGFSGAELVSGGSEKNALLGSFLLSAELGLLVVGLHSPLPFWSVLEASRVPCREASSTSFL